MKKLISILLLIAMCLGLFAGCGEEDTKPTGDLESAKEYLSSMYQTGKKGEPIEITADLDVLKSVVVATVTYTVDWSVEITEGAADSVTVGESKKDNHVKLDIPLHSGEDILFTATATITDPSGTTDTIAFDYKVTGVQLAGAGMTMEELVEAAYALEENTELEGLGVLTGKVTMINTPYDEGYKNVTITIQVGDLSDKPIKCYRLTGDEAAAVGINDTVTVSGTLKNYNGNVQFDAGCMLDELVKSTEPVPEAPADPKEIVAAAYALESNAALPYSATLTGVITTIDTPYDAGFGNVTVTMVVEGCETQPIKCYRLKGEGADMLASGDTITVTGNLMNYNGTIEFGQGCNLDSFTKGDGEVIMAPADPKQIVAEAYALTDGASLPYSATLTGVITSVDSPYDPGYQNITVTITVEGCESQPIVCYRLKGTGADTLAVGDTITVAGVIKNYGGVIEFDAGCSLTAVVKGDNQAAQAPSDPKQIVDDAYNLAKDTALPYMATLSGVVYSVDDAYNPDYQNVTVTIQVAGRETKPIKCYRLKGEGADQIAKGDTITVTGIIKNYGGVIEFDAGCRLDSRTSGGGTVIVPETDPAKIMAEANKLGKDQEMAYDVTLSGKVTAVEDAYTEEFKNITVSIAVTGTRNFLKCYRLKGTGVDKVAVGDTITVTGRIKNYNGTVEMVNGNMTQRTSGGGTAIKPETDALKIVDAAYGLGENQELAYDATLTGKVTAVEDAYSDEFKNITVVMQVSGRESKPIKCYHLKGDGVDKVATGDTITVKGRLKNFYGTVEFVNCTMTKRVSGGGTAIKQETDPAKILEAANKLKENEEMAYDVTLSGKVTVVDDAYDEEDKNISVTIAVSGTRSMLKVYGMKGDGVDKVAVNDTITVTGRMKNYYGTIELVRGTMTSRTSGGGTAVTVETDPLKIVDAAYNLAKDTQLAYDAELTGKIVTLKSPYDKTYMNMTVVIAVAGREDKPIECYRMKGDNVSNNLCVGDTITVTGRLKNYGGTVEFDAGCKMTNWVPGGVTKPSDPKAIVDAAFKLEKEQSLPYFATLSGVVTKIEEKYSDQYKNVTLRISVQGTNGTHEITCYRMKGDDAATVAEGDTITVTGVLKRYYKEAAEDKPEVDKIEFDAGCTLDKKG